MNTGISRRAVLQALAVLTVAPLAAGAQPALPLVEIYKSPGCGCCKDWIKHLEANGFKVKVNDVEDSRTWRARFGMPEKFGSCHTAVVGGYVAEGHAPAAEVKRLLHDKPAALGITVTGMPIGSPGMDGPEYKRQKDRFNVLLVAEDGAARAWASYN